MNREQGSYTPREVDERIQQLMGAETDLTVERVRKTLQDLLNLREGFSEVSAYDVVQETGAVNDMDADEVEKFRKEAIAESEEKKKTMLKSLIDGGAFTSEDEVESALSVLEMEAAQA